MMKTFLPILEVKIELPVMPDYAMEDADGFCDAIHGVKGCRETMMHDSSWARFEVAGNSDAECLEDLRRIREEIVRVIREFKVEQTSAVKSASMQP